ncbi:MAG: AbiEi antitoxin N-terminal domain-containing protein, partial [Candidatus Berkiella sp.]
MSIPNSKNINHPVRAVGQTKISQLLKRWPKGTVAVQPWLNSQEVFRQLAVRYVQGKWLTKIGKGAYIKEGDIVDWTGGVYSLQSQLGFKVHVAGLTALEILGYGHFVPMGEGNPKWLSKHKTDKRPIPVWFRDYFKKDNVTCIEQGLFDGAWDKALVEHSLSDYKIMVANPERAILEYLHF